MTSQNSDSCGLVLQLTTEKHLEKAEQSLQKAVKLDPTHVEAWIQLGECYKTVLKLLKTLQISIIKIKNLRYYFAKIQP